MLKKSFGSSIPSRRSSQQTRVKEKEIWEFREEWCVQSHKLAGQCMQIWRTFERII
jgi:hypothetical protein